MRGKQSPTVYSAVVKNTTQLRLRTPVLNVQSRKAAASTLVKRRTVSNGAARSRKKNDKNTQPEKDESEGMMTTTSPFIINRMSKNTDDDVSTVIDGNAVLSNFNVDDLTDEERRDMLTNIFDVIQNKADSEKSSTKSSSTKRNARSKNKAIVTKLINAEASNIRIVSSMDELTTDKSLHKSANPPIYVILLPQNKKKK